MSSYPVDFDYGAPGADDSTRSDDGLTIQTNAPNLQVQQPADDYAPGLRIAAVGLFSHDYGGLPYTEAFITVRNSGAKTLCDIHLSSTLTDSDGDVILEEQHGRLDGPLMQSDRFPEVCLEPGAEGVAFMNTRPARVTDIRAAAKATFEVSSYTHDPQPIDGPSIESLQAINQTVRNVPRVDIDTFTGKLVNNSEALTLLALRIYVRDEGGFFRDRADAVVAQQLAPNEATEFELRASTLKRTHASKADSVLVAFAYQLERD